MSKRYADTPLITDENLINFRRTQEQLEIFWLYCGFSVGKARDPAQKALAKLLDMGRGKTPFARVRSLIKAGTLRSSLEATRIGAWNRLERFLRESVTRPMNLRHATREQLQQVHGIAGAKSRFFLLCTRRNARCAVLDRHILAHLRDVGHDVPEETPSSRKEYERIEQLWLAEVDKSGMTPAEYNLKRWRERAR